MLDRLGKNSKAKPTELGPYLEGDILFQEKPRAAPRSGIAGDYFRWPNGKIIFQFSQSFCNNQKLSLLVEELLMKFWFAIKTTPSADWSTRRWESFQSTRALPSRGGVRICKGTSSRSPTPMRAAFLELDATEAACNSTCSETDAWQRLIHQAKIHYQWKIV